MKKLISILLATMCALSLSACGKDKIEATVNPFPKFQGVDFKGNTINNEIFKDYDATIVNFWTNDCGSCIEEMPDLEDYFQDFKGKNINLIAVAASAGDSEVERIRAEEILKEKGVTYTNIIPHMESEFYKDFINKITGYPITYIVNSDGNIIGAPLIGVVKKQEEKLISRLNQTIK